MIGDYRDDLQEILDAIDESTEFTKDISFEIFIRRRRKVNAVVRSLNVVGEAPPASRMRLLSRAVGVPWKFMAGMRNKLIHEYFGVDLSMAWTVNKIESPTLSPQIEPPPTDLDAE